MSDVYDLVGELTRVALSLVGGLLGFRILYTVFIAQIDLAAGRPGGMADAAVELIAALVLLQLAYAAPGIGRSAAGLAQAAAGPEMRAGQVVALLGRILFTPLFELALTLAVCAVLVSVVLLFFRSQLAVLGGMAARLGDSWLHAAGAVLLLAFGLLAVRLGLSIAGGL